MQGRLDPTILSTARLLCTFGITISLRLLQSKNSIPLASEEITEEALEDANNGALVGNYKRIRDAQYIDNMMQHVGRGSVRKIGENAVAGEMTAYIHTDTTNFEDLLSSIKIAVTTLSGTRISR